MDYNDGIPGLLRIEKNNQQGWLHLDDMTVEMFPEEYEDVWSFEGGPYACVRQGTHGGGCYGQDGCFDISHRV